MAITVVFDPPLPTDPPSTFDSKAFTLLGDLNDWSTQANAVANQINGAQPNLDIVAGNIANINAAVADLPALSAKVSKTGDTMSGPLSVPAGASGAQVPQAQEIAGLVRAMAVGVVSQSGGVPTGGILDRGANANGQYIRYADGTQICWHALPTAAGGTNWVYPISFAGDPIAVANEQDTGVARFYLANSFPGFATLRAFDSSISAHGPGNARVIAIGRWF